MTPREFWNKFCIEDSVNFWDDIFNEDFHDYFVSTYSFINFFTYPNSLPDDCILHVYWSCGKFFLNVDLDSLESAFMYIPEEDYILSSHNEIFTHLVSYYYNNFFKDLPLQSISDINFYEYTVSYIRESIIIYLEEKLKELNYV